MSAGIEETTLAKGTESNHLNESLTNPMFMGSWDRSLTRRPGLEYPMVKILAITNQKGGVGKTTTSINLAASLAAARRRVLLIDLDPQGNATTGSGVDKRNLQQTVYQVLLGSLRITDVRITSTNGKYDLIPANRDLAGAEIEMVGLPQRETRLKEAVGEIEDEDDFILIDCPPALNLLTLNGLCAAPMR